MNKIHIAGPSITSLEKTYVSKAMDDWYEDPYYFVEEFEKRFATYHKRKFALMTPNCTTAMHLILAGLGIGVNDEVICPNLTWIGSVAGISYLGANPIFCDVEEQGWCLSPDAVEAAITPHTKAIIAVGLYGNMPNFQRLSEIAEKYKIPLIEDAAESLGSTLDNQPSGSFGVASVFSFHRTKTITTGEGGMLLLDDEQLYERCVLLRDHGRNKKTPLYMNEEVTFKYMPFNVQAALGLAQFERLNELIKIKRDIFLAYNEVIKDFPEIDTNIDNSRMYNSAWMTTLIFPKELNLTKQSIMSSLIKRGVPTRPIFYSLTSLPAYNQYQNAYLTKTPVAHSISTRGINLPSAMNLDEEQISFICTEVREFLEEIF
jgi:perosamine synthetase